MNRLKITFFLCFVFLISLSGTTHSACLGGDNGVWTTSGNEAADINDCISVAKKGDTIRVMEGTGEVYWSASAVTIPAAKPLKIIGPGSSKLTINLSGNYAFLIDPYDGSATSPGTRISGFKFVSPLDSKYYAIFARGGGWRIDHCAYESKESASSTTAGGFVYSSGLNTSIQPHGVIDNNDIKNGKIITTAAGNYISLSNAWADALDLGREEATYIEDNYFHTSIESNTHKRLVADSNDGGKYVFRYNTVEHCDLLAHGLQAVDRRGTRKWEIYGNTFEILYSYTGEAIDIKSGTGVIFGNDATSAIPYSRIITLAHERSGWSMGGAGTCDGTSSWDGNTAGQNGWLCRDQVGAGGDTAAWVDAAGETFLNTAAPAQIKAPAYFWSNLGVAQPNDIYLYGTSGDHIKNNRDYYNYTASFDGTAGVGCGTLAARPATCTTDVAYWATNQSCTDLTGMVGANPTTPISGTLYKCTAPNTWTAYYTPYTYPHPLRGTNKGATIINTVGGLNAITMVGGLNVINQ